MNSSRKPKTSPGLWLLSLLLFSFLIPREFHFGINDFQFNFARVVMIFSAFYILVNIVRYSNKWLFVDIVALITFAWPVVAYLITSGLAVAFESGGVIFLETCIPYFLTRITIKNYIDLKTFSIRLLICIFILVILGLPESLSGRFLTHDISGLITGNPFYYSVSQRLGLWRAMGSTDHPIVFGTLCCSGFLIAFCLSQREEKYIIGAILCLVGTFISLSSGPLLGLVSQIFFAIWIAFFRGFNNRWVLLLALVIFAYIVVDFYSNRDPFRVMFSYLLFNTGTGYARYYMWINGIYLVNYEFFTMLFGYGNAIDYFQRLESTYWAYAMSRSVDSFWLVQLLQFGWFILVLNIWFLSLAFRRMWTHYLKSTVLKEKQIIKAYLICGLSLTLIACTVDFWGQIASFYYVMIASALQISPEYKKKNLNTRIVKSTQVINASN